MALQVLSPGCRIDRVRRRYHHPYIRVLSAASCADLHCFALEQRYLALPSSPRLPAYKEQIMEFHDHIREANVNALTRIAKTLAGYGLNVTPPVDIKATQLGLDWNIMYGQYQGAHLRVFTSVRGKRLNIYWGPYLKVHKPQTGQPSWEYARIAITAESYQAGLRKFQRTLRKIPNTTLRGQAAVKAWIAICRKTGRPDTTYHILRYHAQTAEHTNVEDGYGFPVDMQDAELLKALTDTIPKEQLEASTTP